MRKKLKEKAMDMDRCLQETYIFAHEKRLKKADDESRILESTNLMIDQFVSSFPFDTPLSLMRTFS